MGTTTQAQTTNKDSWSTPDPVFQALNAEFNFALDVCASHNNTKVSEAYLTEEEDSLSVDWYTKIPPHSQSNFVWCNPPYSNISPWVGKAIEQTRYGVGTVMLVMSDHSVGWFSYALSKASECRLITNGRLSFINPDTGLQQSGNNKGSAIFIFSPFPAGKCVIKTIDRSCLIGYGERIIKENQKPVEAA